MHRFIKITGITFVSLLLLIVLIIGVLLKWVVTPSRLTPIVRQVAKEFITCPHHIEEVDLTFFSTFPQFGLRIKGVNLVNPMEGCPNDTLLNVPELIVKLDVKEFFDNNNIHISELNLIDGMANVFIDESGKDNFSIFNIPDDSIDITVEDSSSFSLPFNNIFVDKLVLTTTALSFIDKKDSLSVTTEKVNLGLKVNNLADIRLSGKFNDVHLSLTDSLSFAHIHLGLDASFSFDLDSMRFVFQPTTISLNEFAMHIKGELRLSENIFTDIYFSLSDWSIGDILALYPGGLPSEIGKLDIAGFLSLKGHAWGFYNDKSLPLVDASLSLRNAYVAHETLPFPIRNLEIETRALADLNKGGKGVTLDVKNLAADIFHSSIALYGQIDDLLGNIKLDVKTNLKARLSDFSSFIPDNMRLLGDARGHFSVKGRVEDLTAMHLEKTNLHGDIRFNDLNVKMDSLSAYLSAPHIIFNIPDRQTKNEKTRWLNTSINFDSLRLFMEDSHIDVRMGMTSTELSLNDILREEKMIFTDLSLHSDDRVIFRADSMEADLLAPEITAMLEYNRVDTTVLPILSAEIGFKDLSGQYTDISAHLHKSALSLDLRPTKKDKSAPRLTAKIKSDAVEAAIEEETKVVTKAVSVQANARYSKEGDHILTQWRPKLQFDLEGAIVDMSSFGESIKIPSIHFSYTNKEFSITDSHIQIGRSDFSLSGDVRNIGKWIQKRDTLVGVLNFTSDHTDVNELMALCSADEDDDKGETDKQEDVVVESTNDGSSSESVQTAFMVPKDVDLCLNTTIRSSKIFNEDVSNLSGRVYVKNGKLVLEEMGFVCKAAKLQLTALYETPFKDDIYLGFDYHMLDVNIEELISMIPQLDTFIPMLSSFRGLAEFHLAAETYLNEYYKVKPSTIRGACSLFGKDLVVLDGETFSQISKLLRFKKKTENKIDSISAEATLYKKEIDVYPFCVSMDNYMVAVGGRHNLDMTFNYHVNVLSPLYLGVNVTGSLDDLHIKLGKCVYAKDFRPIFHRKTDSQAMELRKLIRSSMQRNVKIEYDGVRGDNANKP